MHFFMDISRDDDNDILSIVVGCDKCAVREIYADYPDAKNWVTQHAKSFHLPGESTAIRQVGQAPRLNKKLVGPNGRILNTTAPSRRNTPTPAQDTIAEFLTQYRTLTTQEVADLMEAKYTTTYATLTTMFANKKIRKNRRGNEVVWQALEGPIDIILPED